MEEDLPPARNNSWNLQVRISAHCMTSAIPMLEPNALVIGGGGVALEEHLVQEVQPLM